MQPWIFEIMRGIFPDFLINQESNSRVINHKNNNTFQPK